MFDLSGKLKQDLVKGRLQDSTTNADANLPAVERSARFARAVYNFYQPLPARIGADALPFIGGMLFDESGHNDDDNDDVSGRRGSSSNSSSSSSSSSRKHSGQSRADNKPTAK
jgi:hypothetical protein